MERKIESYDRLPGETAKAYAAFCVYRDLGVRRSLDRAASEFYTEQPPKKSRPDLRQMERWSSQWNWRDRVEQWDRDIEAANRAILVQQNRDRYLAQAHKFRDQTEAIGFGLIAAASRLTILIGHATEALGGIKGKRLEQYTDREIEVLISLPKSLRAVAGSSSVGVDLAADGLGLKDVIEKIEEDLAEV